MLKRFPRHFSKKKKFLEFSLKKFDEKHHHVSNIVVKKIFFLVRLIPEVFADFASTLSNFQIFPGKSKIAFQ